MKFKTKSCISVLISMVFSLSIFAGDLKGRVYSDYFHYTKTHDGANYGGKHGLNFRRIYLTYKNKLENDWSTKFRFEMNSKDPSNSGSTKMSPVIKDMYLAKKMGDHKMIVGISGMPTFSLIEKHWGYRSVEKTPLDLYSIRSSRDTGIAFKGKLGSMANYHFMYGNNSSNKEESNKYKLYALSTVLHATSSIDLELYLDMADSLDKQGDKTALQVFVAWTGAKTKVGAFVTKLSHSKSGTKYKATVASVHVTHKICKKMTVLARLDSVKYDDKLGIKSESGAYKAQGSYLPISDKATKFTTIIAGLDYSATKNVHIIPNIEMVNYEKTEVASNDIVSRVTFSYKF